MNYYKEINTTGIITGVQATPAAPKDTEEYTYTEISQGEYEAILADFATNQPDAPLDELTITQLALAELAELLIGGE